MPNNQIRAGRAKLFLAFDALKGFNEFLREKEKIVVPKKELSEDSLELLQYKLNQVEAGKILKVVYYDGHEYLAVEGMVSKIDLEYKKMIQIVRTQIPIKDIVEMQADYFIE